MKRSIGVLSLLAAFGLTACGERVQELGVKTGDAPAHAGTGKPYADPSWKAGDRKGWEAQLRARSQYGQNDFSRMP